MKTEIPMILGYEIKEAENILQKQGFIFIVKNTEATIKKSFIRETEKRFLRVKYIDDNIIEIIAG